MPMRKDSHDGPNFDSPTAFQSGKTSVEQIRLEEHVFDDMKYKISRSTKDMVGQILKAAENQDDK